MERHPADDETWGPPGSDQEQSLPHKQNQAARVIQRAWRRHIDTHVFKYYKDLISFRKKGDPRLLLRYVNPKETKFPPSIYYKIFTHRPIVDMCANSPKDYTCPAARRPLPGQIHNRGRAAGQEDRSGWYRREENNGWRLLSGKIWLMGDPVTLDSAAKKTEFHYSRIQRRQEVGRRRKQRKIDWMKKMYEDGLLQARTEDPDAALLVDKAAEGMMAAVDQLGPSHVLEWEVDELLEWTNSLNFEEYMNGWKETAMSGFSESYKGSRLVVSQHDQCEFTRFSREGSQAAADCSALTCHVSSQYQSYSTPLLSRASMAEHGSHSRQIKQLPL
ncbi:protein MFI isoform X2 [Lepisosteus oculatus]|uniref:protein MFI isoform X2 n=1 Tax=Lepisosteus oculatus TaxID=7918 RepID=UPI0007401BFB|nr:PREDICTED: uncharacterized protein C11orf65 homolog isoform X2 [Lepisosteus oculatus]